MDEAQGRPVPLRRQLDLDGRGSGRKRVVPVPAPREDDAVWLVDLDELASGRVAGDDVAAVYAPGSASIPIQRMNFCGSTKNSQTVSGLASIPIVRS
jgi:hypothetical protein